MTEIIVEVEELNYRGIRPVERATGIPRNIIGEAIKAEISLKVTNGKVITFHSTGFHANDARGAAVDAVRRIASFIPHGENVKVVFSNSVKYYLPSEEQKEIIAICQN
ncbi:MAG: hypothetical protein WCV41_02090 [Patescibacteria group bacterium]